MHPKKTFHYTKGLNKMEKERIFNAFLERLKKDLNILPDKSEENAHNTLQALWHTAAGTPVSPIKAERLDLPPLLSHQMEILEEFVNSRLSGVPLAHLTERQNFMNLDYIVNKGLYIPRKETELLAKTAITTITDDYASKKNVTIIDLCTGIGTVALAIAHYCKNTRVFGSDIYKPAIDAGEINAKHFCLEDRATFFDADLFDPFDSTTFKGNTDIIVSAPPYISSAKVKNMASEIANHEPEEAFDAGPYGLSIFSKLITNAPEYLSINGYLIFECGLGQGEFLAKRISTNKRYGEVAEIRDENGNVRVLKAKKIN
jgi:release factor glutamine methyltransferase